MKCNLSFTLSLLFLISSARAQDTSSVKFNDTLMMQNIEVLSIRASDKAPFTKTNLNKQQIEERNVGYDLPFLLSQTPSLVANSDAGNGIGYTNLRIRGSDASRINVTLNGIPYNDAESQGTFFVDMPDIASSLNSIQIQRGVGTSTNGAGAFGASINLSTNELNKEKYLELSNAYGSFNTWKNTIKAGTGLIKNHFTVDARFSNITSDGYVDRAFSKLRSFYLSTAYQSKKTVLRFNVISGREKTYQAWNGVPESLLKSDRTYNSAGTDKPGAPYSNETDNYVQTHYQLFLNQKVKNKIAFNLAAFLTRGKGYYENYKGSQKFSRYNLPDVIVGTDTIQKTDLILQQWLDNYFYGTVFSGIYTNGKAQVTIGGGYTEYDGGHYNIVPWAQLGFPDHYKYYNAPAYKRDFNLYLKWMYSLGNGLSAFADIQQRSVRYEINGFKGHPDLYVNKSYTFINPKAGLSYNINRIHIYGSLAVGSREPNRDDFESGIAQLPKPEFLLDWEAGISAGGENYSAGVNFYYMDYINQLINTGMINDVGAYTRTNAGKSYRAGIEIEAAWKPSKWWTIDGNLSLGRNKIKLFKEFIDDYDLGGQKVNLFKNTDIAFSPAVVSAFAITFSPVKNGKVILISKYVGDQFLDNTSDRNRMLKKYFVENIQLNYGVSCGVFREVKLFFDLNNVFNNLYEANGYTYNYFEGGKLHVENYYFPMAGMNFMGGILIKL